MTKDVHVTIDRGDLANPLGLEVSLKQSNGTMEAWIKHVNRDGIAARHGVLAGDQVLCINDHDVEDLPSGSSGRIYLFRLLGTGLKIELMIRRVIVVHGVEDKDGNFTPDNL